MIHHRPRRSPAPRQGRLRPRWPLALAIALLTVVPLAEPAVGGEFQADVRLGLSRAEAPGAYHLDISFDRDDLVAVLVRAPEEKADLVRYTTDGFDGELALALGHRSALETVTIDGPTLKEALRVTVFKEISELGTLGVTIVTADGWVRSQDYRPQTFDRCSLAVKFSEEQEACREVEHECDGCSVSAFCCGGGAPCTGCTPNCWIACPPCIEPAP